MRLLDGEVTRRWTRRIYLGIYEQFRKILSFSTMPKGEKPLSQIWVWDFTAHLSSGVTREILEKQFKDWDCKKWVYQLEKCPSTGNLHYQGRVNLNDKVRVLEGNAMIRTSRTSKEGSKTFSYVMKEDTREAGPWTDKDKPEYIPRWMRDWKPKGWQLEFQERMDEVYSTSQGLRRKIMCIYDPVGCMGKSEYCDYLVFHKGWLTVDTQTLVSYQLGGLVLDQMRERREVPGFVVDVTREITKEKWSVLGSFLENLKNGRVTDGRNKGRQWVFEPPKMIIVINKQIPAGIFSEDRVYTYYIDKEKWALEEFNDLTQEIVDDD